MNYQNQFEEEKRENFLSGLVGAFLFSLAGLAVYVLLYQIGILAWVSGFIATICAIRGYSFFAKGESKKGIIAATVISVLIMVVAWYICLSIDVYGAYQEWYANGEIDFTLTIFEAASSAYLFLSDPEIASAYLMDLLLSVLFCIGGSIGPAKNALNRIRLKQAMAEQQNAPVANAEFEETKLNDDPYADNTKKSDDDTDGSF